MSAGLVGAIIFGAVLGAVVISGIWSLRCAVELLIDKREEANE